MPIQTMSSPGQGLSLTLRLCLGPAQQGSDLTGAATKRQIILIICHDTDMIIKSISLMPETPRLLHVLSWQWADPEPANPGGAGA